MHAGEIYHLWEALNTGYESVSLAESFQMNTDDNELHQILQSIHIRHFDNWIYRVATGKYMR